MATPTCWCVAPPTRGASWDPPLRLGDDPAGDRVVQYLPALAIAPGGRVDAVFYDRRRDPAGVRNDVYLTSSTDRGRSFGANVRLTSESSDSRIGQTYAVASSAGLHEFGSRLGLLSTRSTAVAAWADTRNSPSASIAQDVFAAVVSVAATGQRQQPAILLLPARWGEHALSWLVGAGLGGAVWAARLSVRRRARRRGDQRRELPSVAASALTRPTRRRQAYPAALLALAAVTVTSCAARVPALAPPVVVRVAMSDDDHGGSAYHVERHVRAGRLVFRVRNDGRERHELIVLKLPAEPALSLDALVASSSKRAFPTLIALPPIRPGATGTFAIDATPGRYAMLSFVTAHNGLPDYLNGMRAELVVD